MATGFYLITGTSRGIGEALAQKALEEGNTALGLSRTQPDNVSSEKYHHLSCDLSETTRIGQIMNRASQIIDGQAFGFVCLVNNASATEPFGPIEECAMIDIETHVRIGLIAPMILTSMFVRLFAYKKIRKKVAFISSGAAFIPLPDESIYCSVKSALHMFAQSVGLEQQDKGHGFETVSIGPGMVDTAMQLAVCTKADEEFAMAGFFRKAFADGKLQEPRRVAERIYNILVDVHEQGEYISPSGM